MARSAFHCAKVSGDKNCSVTILGEHDDVMKAAHDHLVSTHELTSDDAQEKVTAATDRSPTKDTIWVH